MTGWLPAPAEELFGPDATAEESYEVLTVDVPPESWIPALRTARDTLGCTYFDWLSAVDEPGTGFRVSAHVVALSPVRRLLVRTTVAHSAPTLASAVSVYAGAAWHERETHEMFGVAFEGHPGLQPLLLPEGFEGHPLRKDFVLAARVAKAWPGAKEPGESEHGGPKRRQMLPPGVPDPNEWGPLKGQLPPAPARPARGAGRTAAPGARPARAGTDRPARRTRTASEGSASQTPETPETPATTETPVPDTPVPDTPAPGAPGTGTPVAGAPATGTPAPGKEAPPAGTPAPRRSRSAGEGSATQRADDAKGAGRTEGAERDGGEEGAADTAGTRRKAPATPRASDAPWHHARPTFDEPEPGARTEPEPHTQPEREPEPRTQPEREPESPPEPATAPESPPEPEPSRPAEPGGASAEPGGARAQPGGASAEPGGGPDESDTPRTPDEPAGGTQ
ncbi:NADH-quinone oxidoreductase subunit C [Streptomyces sp. NPDC008313]|uniref:NADH-quinone oxidoreductase subunit C n=1 Tax=Streptomyces sp. NPDC008313 TaxID=3364826 RepID=UPI0036EB83FF